uniref:Uncharacterized protein n=1 Tax=Meloidogyne hapla TaxID=6305 RepID=A0A1I8AZ31_MELHA
MLTGQVLIFQKKLKEKNDLLLMELYGIPPPSDIRLLSDEYIRQKEGLTPPDSPEFDDYNGIKLRANWEKERLAIAFFPLASGFTNNDPEVQTSIDTANSILTNPTDTEMLKITSGNIQLKDIDEHYNNIIEEELNMNKQQIKDMKGFVAALNDYILPKLGLAYNNLIIKEVLKTTIKPEETLMLNDLNKIEMALNSEEILSDSSKGINLKSTLQNIDNFYFMRHEQIKNGRKGSIAGLPGLLKRNKRAVQRKFFD